MTKNILAGSSKVTEKMQDFVLMTYNHACNIENDRNKSWTDRKITSQILTQDWKFSAKK